jgi:hypothetical protein
MKQKKKRKICFVIYIAGERIYFFIFEVFVKQKKKKRSANHYFYVTIGSRVYVTMPIPQARQRPLPCSLGHPRKVFFFGIPVAMINIRTAHGAWCCVFIAGGAVFSLRVRHTEGLKP